MVILGILAGILAPAEDLNAACVRAKAALIKKHPAEAARIERGLWQVRRIWRNADGTPNDLFDFTLTEFLPEGADRNATFERLQFALERTDGYLRSLSRDLLSYVDLEKGPSLPIDQRLAAYDPSAHVSEDLFSSKVAFVALLNFPLNTYQQRAKATNWTRKQWAESRLTDRFAVRENPASAAKVSGAYGRVESYINGYNIHTGHLLTREGRRLFPANQRLISHWNLRDEIKASYGTPNGPEKQRLLARVMDAIVKQTIPAAVIDKPVDWTPETGAVKANPARENDERYRHWLAIFQAQRARDHEDPRYPTFLRRRFERDAEIPQERIESLLIEILDSPLAAPVAREIERRLARKLEPFDIYYPGFARPTGDEAALDRITQAKYPTAAAFADDIPRLLQGLGFTEDRSRFLAKHIKVEPSRGAGHALGAFRRDDTFHLRTRTEAGGMNYKGYNIAVHEMGHNIEQIFSTVTIDYSLLQGVPNNAFTEALAFVFQARDLELLGQPAAPSGTRALNEFWEARQIAGAALVDLYAWKWLYSNPKASPAQFRAAVVEISRSVWKRFYAPSIGAADTAILGIYSHMVNSGLYLPDYALARVIAFQIEAHFASSKEPLGVEFERLSKLGRLTPDAWMRQATGSALSARPLLEAAEREMGGIGFRVSGFGYRVSEGSRAVGNSGFGLWPPGFGECWLGQRKARIVITAGSGDGS